MAIDIRPAARSMERRPRLYRCGRWDCPAIRDGAGVLRPPPRAPEAAPVAHRNVIAIDDEQPANTVDFRLAGEPLGIRYRFTERASAIVRDELGEDGGRHAWD